MTAIDIVTDELASGRIQFGDLRLLEFCDASFDFATLAMVIGPTNACSSYLEVAVSLCELKRVLIPGGIAYIADAGFQPSVAYAAQCLGFQVFVSKGSSDGMPVGTIFRNPACARIRDSFDGLFKQESVTPISLGEAGDDVAENCNLFFDQGQPIIQRPETGY